jgi:UDP-N-acetylmuramoylalanine--D-glutamate ligase
MNNSSEILDHENFLVFGAARSGLAAARLLRSRGRHVALFDEGPAEKTAAAAETAARMGVPFHRSLADFEFPDAWQVVVLSPGIPTTHPFVQAADESGCVVRSEIEIAFAACPTPVVAVTGTNGKTTVTHLLTHLFRHAGRPALMGGNVGRPLSDAVMDPEAARPGAVIVCEVSSFQLETIERFAPHVALVLNITPDHLDRYGAMTNYIDAKRRVTENQTAGDVLVLNAEDRHCLSLVAQTQAEVLLFSSRRAIGRGAWLEDGMIRLNTTGTGAPLDVMACADIPLPGRHNVENVLAALAAGAAMGLAPRDMADAVRCFEPVPHRIQLVGEIDGVRYYNDSKGTNLDSVEKALQSFEDAPAASGAAPRRRIVLIAGGRDKGAKWASLGILVGRTVKALVTIGEAAPLVRKAWAPLVAETRDAADMAGALALARALAEAGDVVLLSPGCASFDMYRNYEERGDHFRTLVREMAAGSVAATPTAN